MLGTQNAQVGTARERRICILEPDLGELGETGQGGAVVGSLDDPVGIDAGEGGAHGDGENLGVGAAGGVDDFSGRCSLDVSLGLWRADGEWLGGEREDG